MEQGQQFSHLIYEYFYLRFRFGYYQYGDFLPPVDTFCQEFCAAPQTVKNALRRLRDEGYIDMGRGRMTRVVFCQSAQQTQSFTAQFLAKRWDAFEDLYTSAGLLFAPLLVQGLRRMSGEELAALDQLAQRPTEDSLLHFYCLIIQKLENPLAMNFFWEATLFQGFPLARWEQRPTQYSAAQVGERIRALLSAAKAERWEALQSALMRFRRGDLARITAYLRQRVQPLPKEQQLPFVWRVYRDRPQICCNLASRILHEIYIGEYRGHAFLPSYGEMAAKYGVSVNTVRRTVGMLNHLGAVKTVNGMGTQVFSLDERCNPPDFQDPIIRRNLAFFVQSFELVRYTCQGAVRALVEETPPEQRLRLAAQLEENLRCGRCGVSLWDMLIAIASRSRLQVVREFYRTAYGLFLWGYPLKASRGETPALDRTSVAFTKEMIRRLKQNDAQQCAALMQEVIAQQFHMAETYLLAQGLRPEELRLSRSIRFLSVDIGAAPQEK